MNDSKELQALDAAVDLTQKSTIGGSSFAKAYKSCSHRPTLVLSGKYKGKLWELYAGTMSKVEDYAWECGLIVNCTGHALFNRCNRFPRGLGLGKWTNPLASREAVLGWLDFGIPGLPLDFWCALLRVIRKRRRTLLFCVGGHGRTGTAVSILTALEKQLTGEHAISRVRANYCKKAVENHRQEEYVKRLAQLAGIK